VDLRASGGRGDDDLGVLCEDAPPSGVTVGSEASRTNATDSVTWLGDMRTANAIALTTLPVDVSTIGPVLASSYTADPADGSLMSVV